MLTAELSILESKGLVTLAAADPELEYIFRHPLLQEAAYSSLTHADRRSLHRDVGAALEALYPERQEELAPRLADHFLQAGDLSRAAHYEILSGRAAQRVYANPEAILHYQRALKLVRGSPPAAVDEELLTDLYRGLGRVLELTDRYQDALAHYQAMEADARAAGNQKLELAALVARGTIQSTPNVVFDAGAAQAAADRALELAQSLGDRAAEAKILWNLLLMYNFTNQIQKAFEAGERSLAIARELDLKEQIAYTLNDMSGFTGYQTGDMAGSLAMLEEARDLWRSLNNLPMLADSLANLGIYDFIAGELDRSLERSTEAYRIADSIENVWGRSFSLGVHSFVLTHRGLADQALADIDLAVKYGKQAGFIPIQQISLSEKAFLYGLLGAPQLGIPFVEEALSIDLSGISFWRPFAYASRAYLAMLLGDLDEADAILQQAGKSGFEPEVMLISPLFLMTLAEIHLARSRYAELQEYLSHYLERIRHFHAWGLLGSALMYQGMALYAQQRREEASAVFQEALHLADEQRIYPVCWRVSALLADLARAEGQSGDAARLREEAAQAAGVIADHAGSAELRACFLARPDVRQVMEGVDG